jgi:chromosome segregation ATPase
MASTQLIAWSLAGAAAAAAVVLFGRLRTLAAQSLARARDCERLAAELEAAREQIEKQSAAHRRRGEEMSELHRKLDKLKKRGGGEHRSGRAAAPSQVQDLERELELARQARDAAREEVSGIARELSRLRSEQAEAASPVAADDSERLVHSEAQRVQAEAQRARAEARAEQLSADLSAAQKQVQRLRAKHDTQEQLYVALRGELDAKKDRLRRQQEQIERLQALKVAVVDPLPPEPEARDEISSS